MGDGSWDRGLEKLTAFRLNGLSMPGVALGHHYDNCLKMYNLLLSDLFDALSHFTQSREASNIQLSLSRRVYETGGAFETHEQYQGANTVQLNTFLALNPAFALTMGAGASSSGSGSFTQGADPGSQDQSPSKNKYHFRDGKLYFGKGESGPQYVSSAIMSRLKQVDPKITGNNFCLLQYLSVQSGLCKNPRHTTHHRLEGHTSQLCSLSTGPIPLHNRRSPTVAPITLSVRVIKYSEMRSLSSRTALATSTITAGVIGFTFNAITPRRVIALSERDHTNNLKYICGRAPSL